MSVNKHISREELEERISVKVAQIEHHVAVLEELRAKVQSEAEGGYTYEAYELDETLYYVINELNDMKGWLIELYEDKRQFTEIKIDKT